LVARRVGFGAAVHRRSAGPPALRDPQGRADPGARRTDARDLRLACYAIGMIAAVVAIIVAPFIGSFLAVVALRWPQGRGVVAGRSACDSCGHTLGPIDLVPLASFAVLRGRCRYCGARIDPLHAVVEVGALIVAIWAVCVTAGGVLA